MKLIRLTCWDIRFQIKYGFYLIYAIFTLLYIIVIRLIPEGVRSKAATILIFSDPAAIGLFFMGAIILLEKSQRINTSLAISPLKVCEYIWAKVLSLAFIGCIVGGVLAIVGNIQHMIIVLLGVFGASVLFSLCSLIVAMKIDTVNKFMISTIPFEILIFVPPILYYFGLLKSLLWFIHPGIAAIYLIGGNNEMFLICIIMLFIWIILAFNLCLSYTKTAFSKLGGGKI